MSVVVFVWIGVVVACSMGGMLLALTPAMAGTLWMWVILAVCQVPCATVAVFDFARNRELGERLAPRWGDITVGMLSGMGLLVMVWFVSQRLAPMGTAQHQWIVRAYEHTGQLGWIEKNWLAVLVAVLIVCALEELSWRGIVIGKLESIVGSRRAWPIAGLLYGLGFLPSLWMLRTQAGLNPLMVGSGILGGFVWSFMAVRTGRLVPSFLSHATFLWFVVIQFRWMGVNFD